MRCLMQAAIAVILLGAASLASAIPIGPDVTGTQFESDHGYSDSGEFNWDIDNSGNPYNFSQQENSGPWIKNLTGSPEVGIGGEFTLRETIEVGDPPAFTDWTMEFITEGWEWTEGTLWVDGTAHAFGSPDSNARNAMTFLFLDAPILPGTVFEITATMKWAGTPSQSVWAGVPAEIQIMQFPVIPEPATLVLMGIGLGVMGAGSSLKRRIQRKK